MKKIIEIATLSIFLLLVGCSHHVIPGPAPHSTSFEQQVRKELLLDYQSWRGAPHRLGGASRSGIDCSAYTQRVYRDLFGIQLPRTTSEQRRVGAPVHGRQLRPGDLLFFNTGILSRHVGIYLGDGSFVHVSSKLGVTRSSLENPYWRKHFKFARRVLRTVEK